MGQILKVELEINPCYIVVAAPLEIFAYIKAAGKKGVKGGRMEHIAFLVAH